MPSLRGLGVMAAAGSLPFVFFSSVSQQLSNKLAVGYYWLTQEVFSCSGMPERAANSLALDEC